MKKLTFETLLDKFKEYLIMRNSSERTIELYTQVVGFFFEFLKNKRGIDNVLLITKDDLANYSTYLYYYRIKKDKELSPKSRYAYLSSVSSFFKFLTRNGLIPYNPMADITLPKCARTLPRDIMDRREIDTILTQPNIKTMAGIRDRAILEVLYSTGIRTSELINLTLYDIDVKRGLLKVNKGKGQKDRIVPLGKVACKYLKKYLRRSRSKIRNNNKCLTLFLSLYGNKFSRYNFSKLIKKYAAKANVKKHITPHSFRHTCATQMLEQGADIRYIQELLGHQSLQTTQVYTRVTIKDLKKAHARFHPRERARIRI